VRGKRACAAIQKARVGMHEVEREPTGHPVKDPSQAMAVGERMQSRCEPGGEEIRKEEHRNPVV
jgi:hypothetical protein